MTALVRWLTSKGKALETEVIVGPYSRRDADERNGWEPIRYAARPGRHPSHALSRILQ